MELKVFIIDCNEYAGYMDYSSLSDESFMDEAERQGKVYSIKGFEKAFNEGLILTYTDVIRIL